MRILICDDSAVMRGILRRVLDQYGSTANFELSEAKDGEQALTLIAKHTPDLVFLDWNMPNLDGLGVVKRLRSQGSQVPIVMITSVSDPERVYEACEAGVTDYIEKPVSPITLWERIKEHTRS
jgi:two-component system chemotaxis response regulator CheY